jgi:hypothetical protein
MRVVACLAVGLILAGCGEHEGAGEITGARVPVVVTELRGEMQVQAATRLARAAGESVRPKQILFGDLHVHSTFSADAFMMSLPIMQGEGAHPVADACDFARYCSALDFWSINDHAEGVTPQRWRETKESIRQCNALAGDPENPDIVAFLGWEWTQIGRTPADHYGHKNVIFLDTQEERVPRRPIHSASFATRAMRERPPLYIRYAPVVLDWPNRQRYLDFMRYQDELRAVPDCADDIDTRQLPDECLEGAPTPEVLFRKLSEWGFDSIVIPHGTTWGIYTPQHSSWDKQLTARQHDPKRQILIEVYSGHGNSEEYREWRAADLDAAGSPVCLPPHRDYEPCCWRAGELIRARCTDPTSEECERRVIAARHNYLAAGSAGRLTVPGSQLADWKNCGSCPDCFNPSMNYRPASSVQYTLAISGFENGAATADPRRFHFGFIASSDNHRARPGTGYKEYGRLYNTEASGPKDEEWFYRLRGGRQEPSPESIRIDRDDPQSVPPYLALDFERQASFFMTGGLVAAHAAGRSREEIWAALKRREVYGTSGPRILLWFDLLNGSPGPAPMGSRAKLAQNPRFRVRALGAFKQRPGCPEVSVNGLSPERLESLCHGECYNPGDERHTIARIEVVRIRPQQSPGEPVASLIEDPWRVLMCPHTPAGCVVEFEDNQFLADGRDAIYYVRAIQEPSLAVNSGALRCADPACTTVDPCYGDYRTPTDDDCLRPNEERAWSSPVYLSPAS